MDSKIAAYGYQLDGFKTLFSKVADVINTKGGDIKAIHGHSETLNRVDYR